MNTAMPELHPVPLVSPWYHLCIDFVGPFHTPAKQGSYYILTIADYFSKFVQAIPCRTKEACYISDALFKVSRQLINIYKEIYNQLYCSTVIYEVWNPKSYN